MCKCRVLVLVFAAVPTMLLGCSRVPFNDNSASAEASAGLEVSVGGSGAILGEQTNVARDSSASPGGAASSGSVPSAVMVGAPVDVQSLCAGKSIDDECIIPLLGARGSKGRCKLPTSSGSPGSGRLFCFTRLDLPCEGKNVGDECARATPGPRQIVGRCIAAATQGVGDDGQLLCLTPDDLACEGKAIGEECELPKATRFRSRGQREYKGYCRTVPSGRRGNDSILLCAPKFH